MRNGEKCTRINVRIPENYEESISRMVEDQEYDSASELVRDAIKKYGPAVGYLPPVDLEKSDSDLTFRYKRASLVDSVIKEAKNSDFATRSGFIRTAIGLHIGEEDFDFEKAAKLLDEMNGED